jgi:hypothetical protein
MTPSLTAWIALFSWPAASLVFWRLWNLPLAVVATMICGYLFLPEQVAINLPALPPLNKDTIPALAALLLIWLTPRDARTAQGVLPGWLPRDRVALVLIGLMVLGAFGTALANRAPTFNGPVRLPGLQLYDGFSLALRAAVLLVPFLIARKILATPEGQRTLAVFFVGAAAGYAVLALWEVRMSPQLNLQLYGFRAHSWLQHVRGGGFRPMLFLGHGLLVGIFLAAAILIAFGLARAATGRRRAMFAAAGVWLLVTILLCKVLGAFAIALALLPVVLFASQRTQVLVAFGIGLVVLTYPVLRSADLIPTTTAVSLAERVSVERADSLAFRFRMEDRLLARAKQNPVFGWGGYGRNEVYDETGRDTTVTDGRWLVLFGQGGWVRYIGEFGLLLWGIFRLAFLPRDRIDPVAVALAMGLTANMIDLLPNAGVSPLTWMMAGALVGRLELRGTERQPAAETVSAGRPAIRYARDLGPPKTVRGAPSGHRQEPGRSRMGAGRTQGGPEGR